jgi:hypothetical protein
LAARGGVAFFSRQRGEEKVEVRHAHATQNNSCDIDIYVFSEIEKCKRKLYSN